MGVVTVSKVLYVNVTSHLSGVFFWLLRLEVGRNRVASAGWGPGGTVSLSLLHPLRLTCMRGE